MLKLKIAKTLIFHSKNTIFTSNFPPLPLLPPIFSLYSRCPITTQAGLTADNIVASAFFMPIRQLAEPISIA